MKALDLFCGGGGAALGLLQAGFDVIGIDNNPIHARRYPGVFVCANALCPPVRLQDFDLVWASPPCQRYSFSTLNRGPHAREKHPDLIDPVRHLLATHPITIIENVPGAPLRQDAVLTGSMVGLPRIFRRRHFELSFPGPLLPKPVRPTRAEFLQAQMVTVTTSMCSTSHYYYRKAMGLPGRVSVEESREVMGIIGIPMTMREVGEAVPPPYAELLATYAKLAIEERG